jgi:hypothetical protein
VRELVGIFAIDAHRNIHRIVELASHMASINKCGILDSHGDLLRGALFDCVLIKGMVCYQGLGGC